MIKLLTEDRTEEFLDSCSFDEAGAVIYTRFLAYGFSKPDTRFWVYENSKGEIDGVLSTSGKILTVSPFEIAKEEETIEFAKVLGVSEQTRPGKYILAYTGGKIDSDTRDITGENVRDIFPVIFPDKYEAVDGQNEIFSEWYTDISHKIRHGLIHGKCLYVDNKCVSTAITSGETIDLAVISAVATKEGYRNRGFGKQVVLSLASSLDKKIVLMTDSEELKEMYERWGFSAATRGALRNEK